MFKMDWIDWLANAAMWIGAIVTYFAMRHYKKERDKLQKEIREANDLVSLRGSPLLVAIERNGRSLIFTFACDGDFIEVETMALMSTDLPELRRKLRITEDT